MEHAEENLNDLIDYVERVFVCGGWTEAEVQKLQDFQQKGGMFIHQYLIVITGQTTWWKVGMASFKSSWEYVILQSGDLLTC